MARLTSSNRLLIWFFFSDGLIAVVAPGNRLFTNSPCSSLSKAAFDLFNPGIFAVSDEPLTNEVKHGPHLSSSSSACSSAETFFRRPGTSSSGFCMFIILLDLEDYHPQIRLTLAWVRERTYQRLTMNRFISALEVESSVLRPASPPKTTV